MALRHYIFSQVGNSNGMNVATTQYFIIKNSSYGAGGRPTESHSQVLVKVAGVYSLLYIRVPTNNINTGTIIVSSRLNTADGAISISVTAGVTGDFSDLVNSDTVVVDDTYSFKAVIPGSSGTFVLNSSISFVCDSDKLEQSPFTVFTTSAASTTYFVSSVGVNSSNTTESDCQIKIKNSVTVGNAQIRCYSNTRSATTVKSRKNTADGNILITITASTTGLYSDLSNTDSLVANDLYCFSPITGTGGGSVSFSMIQTEWSYSSAVHDVYSFTSTVGGIVRAASASQHFVVAMGATFSSFITTETARRLYVPSPITLSKFSCNVTANTYSVSATSTVRKNAANVNGALTITNGVTGVFEDATNSDSFTTGDFLAYSITGGSSGSATFLWFGAQFTDMYGSISVSDSMAIAESKTMEMNSFISKSDSITISETVSITKVFNLSVSDSVTLTESKTVTLISDISKTESITITESKTATLISDISKTESITISESKTLELNSSISKSDSITITETVARTLVSLVNVSDSLTLSDNISILNFLNISQTDSITLTESVTVTNSSLGNISVSDSISISESITFSVTNTISVSDSISLTESITILASQLGNISITDSISLSDLATLTNTQLGGISVNDSITLTESRTISVLNGPDPLNGIAIMRSKENEYAFAMDVLDSVEQ